MTLPSHINLNFEPITYDERGQLFQQQAMWGIMSDNGELTCFDLYDVDNDHAYCGHPKTKQNFRLCSDENMACTIHGATISAKADSITYYRSLNYRGPNPIHNFVWRNLKTGQERVFPDGEGSSISADGSRLFFINGADEAAVYDFQQANPIWSLQAPLIEGQIPADGQSAVFSMQNKLDKTRQTLYKINLVNFQLDELITLTTAPARLLFNDASRDLNRILITTTEALLPSDKNKNADVYMYEISTRKFTLVSFSPDGNANGLLNEERISPSGKEILLLSWDRQYLEKTGCKYSLLLMDTDTSELKLVRNQAGRSCSNDFDINHFGETGFVTSFFASEVGLSSPYPYSFLTQYKAK